MPRQSTRHSYKSRRERRVERNRNLRIVLAALVLLLFILTVYRWDRVVLYVQRFFD